MFRTHVYIIVIYLLMVESFSFYKNHDFCVYMLSLKFPVRGICGFVRRSNSGSLWCLTLVLQFPLGYCKPLFLASPIPALWLLYYSGSCQSREIILGSPEKPEHEPHARLFPVTHSGELLVFICLVYSAGSWSSRAICCPSFSAGPWHLDIPWSVHSPGQEPAIWAVLQSATCWVYAGVPLHQEKTEHGHSACCSSGDGRMDRGL